MESDGISRKDNPEHMTAMNANMLIKIFHEGMRISERFIIFLKDQDFLEMIR